MDYCYKMSEAHLLFSKDLNSLLLERMESEATFMLASLESLEIITEEAEEVVNNNAQKTASLWQHMKDFFKKIFNMFVEKTRQLTGKNKEWLDKNYNKFEKIDYTNLKLTMIPFWSVPMNTIKNEARSFSNALRAAMNNSKNVETYKDFEEMKKGLCSKYLDSNGDITNGLKNYYRNGEPNKELRQIELSGNDLKEKVLTEMREYCSNYDRDVEPFVRNLMNDAEKEIKYIEDTMKRQAVKDSFCMIEDMPYLCTEAAYCTNSIVFEANEQQQSNNQNQSQNTQQNDNQQKQNSEKDDSPKPTEVSIKNTSKPGDVQKDKLDQKYGNMSSDELKFAKNAMQIIQTNITCVMTVLEERFTTYMKAMRLIISESNAKDTTSETTDDENNRKADTEKQIADRKASKNTPENNKTK